MKRVTPEMVIEAYNKTGLEPIQAEWYYEGPDNTCKACGLGAVAIAWGADLEKDDLEKFMHSKGFAEEYISGFVYGFDGDKWSPTLLESLSDRKQQGYLDGKAVLEQLHKLAYFEGGEN